MAGHQHLKLTKINGSLSCCDRHTDLGSHLNHGIHIVRRNRIFQDHRAVRLHCTPKGHSLRQRHAAVYLQNKVKVISDCFPADTHLLHLPLNAAGEEFALAIRCADRAVAENFCGGKAHLLQLLVLFCQFLLILGQMHHGSIHANLIPGLSSEKLIDWNAQGLALDIPEGNVKR